MRTIHALFIVAPALFVACGDEAVEPAAEDLCAAICERDQACGAASCGTCQLEPDRFRAEARAAMLECYQALACTESDDQCLAAGLEASPRRALDDQFTELCVGAVATCGLDDDYCVLSPLFEAVHVEAAIACFDGACEVDSCVASALGLR